MSSTIDHKEIDHFAKDSARWWDEAGPFAPLHRLNPVRLSYIKSQICNHYERDVNDLKALKGLSILDVGCGGGLVCEPLARMGGNVTGVDADGNAIDVAKDHAAQSGLKINYKAGAAESFLSPLSPRKRGSRGGNKKIADQVRDDGGGFDVVLALEIIEHVPDPALFVQNVMNLVKPGGLVIFSTLNRTPKSYALGIVAAEYILRWVPRGTHDWKKFVKPSELRGHIVQAGGTAHDITGLTFNPLKNDFQLSKTDIAVNYFISGKS